MSEDEAPASLGDDRGDQAGQGNSFPSDHPTGSPTDGAVSTTSICKRLVPFQAEV